MPRARSLEQAFFELTKAPDATPSAPPAGPPTGPRVG
jgi:hypothetical protein